MTHNTYEFALTLPLTQATRHTAQTFAAQQPTPQKAEQVRLNTLAVLVVNDYLQLMDVPTDLAASDSWNSIVRVMADVADLELPEVGRLECRPVKPQAATCSVPPETWDDRVGYVVVEVDEVAQEAQLLGFVPAAPVEELPLSQLRSPEALLDHLYELRHSTEVTPSPLATALTHLGQWLQGAIDEGWQTVESVLNPVQLNPAYAFRSWRGAAVRQAKRLALGAGLPAVALVVDVNANTGTETHIRLQLHPIAAPAGLPRGVVMRVLDETGAVAIEAEATGLEDLLELEIDGTPGEQFSVQVCLNDTQVTEPFVI